MDALSDVEEHFWLTRSVARTIGLNLAEAMAAGQLTPDGYTEMVARCRLARCAEACAQWLGQQAGGEADAPPPYCAHLAQFSAQRREHSRQTIARGSSTGTVVSQERVGVGEGHGAAPVA